MSMDVLKNKIRKLRNPSALTIAPTLDSLPPAYLTEFGNPVKGMGEYCCRVLEALKGQLPAVKVSFGAFSLLGPEGLVELQKVLDTARELGYYVILDWQRQEDETSARAAAKLIFSGGMWTCDGVVLSCYAGSGSVKPYITEANKERKDVYVVLKTGGKVRLGAAGPADRRADGLHRCGGPAGPLGRPDPGALRIQPCGGRRLRQSYDLPAEPPGQISEAVPAGGRPGGRQRQCPECFLRL